VVDWARASRIAHRTLPVASPIEAARVGALVEALDPAPTDHVVDLGCGEGEWVVRIFDRWRCSVVGVDLDEGALGAARAKWDARGRPAGVHLVAADAGAFLAADDRQWNGLVCVGSSHVVGGRGALADVAAKRVAPHGRLLLGDGFWARPPSPAALAALDATPDELDDLDTLLARYTAAGFDLVDVVVATDDEWDHYEHEWSANLEDFARRFPNDPDAEALAALAAEHRQAYLSGYRGVLGFVTAVARRTIG
jgi:SAM-dependent methyltransferase